MEFSPGGIVAGEALAAEQEDHLDGGPAPVPDEDAGELPTRSASPRRSHTIRRMDDPEILERVLAGLLSIP